MPAIIAEVITPEMFAPMATGRIIAKGFSPAAACWANFGRRKRTLVQYDYRHTDGELFACVKPTLDECRTAIINGKKMKDWLRFAMAWWHTLCAEGGDQFGGVRKQYHSNVSCSEAIPSNRPFTSSALTKSRIADCSA